MSDPKTTPTNASVKDFLAAIEHPRKRADAEAVCQMMREVTGEAPRMWGTSIVGFGTYEVRYESGRSGEWPIVGFSPRKQNLTLYIMPGFDAYAPLLERLGKHTTGRSCLYVNKLADVDTDVLRELVGASVSFMRAKYSK